MDKLQEEFGSDRVPSVVCKAVQSSLEEHLANYVADLTALQWDDQYFYELKNRVRRLIKECGSKQLKDVTADSYQASLATNLARAGTAPRVAMEIMRHSDMRLTAKTYTDEGLLPVANAVLKLPSSETRRCRHTNRHTQFVPGVS